MNNGKAFGAGGGGGLGLGFGKILTAVFSSFGIVNDTQAAALADLFDWVFVIGGSFLGAWLAPPSHPVETRTLTVETPAPESTTKL